MDFSNSRFMSVLALFEENKENSSSPKLPVGFQLPVGFKDQMEWLMYHSCKGSVDFLLDSEKYFSVFIKKKIPILHLKQKSIKKKSIPSIA